MVFGVILFYLTLNIKTCQNYFKILQIFNVFSIFALFLLCIFQIFGMNINVKEKRHHYDASKLSLMVVGAARFELATSRSRTERATGLRYAPSEN